jgi:hypothetical protein
LPKRWFCEMNPSAAHNNCKVPEEAGSDPGSPGHVAVAPAPAGPGRRRAPVAAQPEAPLRPAAAAAAAAVAVAKDTIKEKPRKGTRPASSDEVCLSCLESTAKGSSVVDCSGPCKRTFHAGAAPPVRPVRARAVCAHDDTRDAQIACPLLRPARRARSAGSAATA